MRRMVKKAEVNNCDTKDDLAALRQDLEQKLQANSDAIDALRKLVDEFQPELTKLGQDVAAVQARPDALGARVGAARGGPRRGALNGSPALPPRGNAVTRVGAIV